MADSKRKQTSKQISAKHVNVPNQPSVVDGPGQIDVEQDGGILHSFETELAWCIEELKLGLSNYTGSKSDIKRAEDAVKVLKILESSSAPLPKKRCVMKATFGDYRKKIEASRKKTELAWKNSKMAQVQQISVSSSKFLKKSSSHSSSIVTALDTSNSSHVQQDMTSKILVDGKDGTLQRVGDSSTTVSDKLDNRTSTPFVFGFDIDSQP